MNCHDSGRKVENGGRVSDGLTIDFFGLKGFPHHKDFLFFIFKLHRDFIIITGIDQINPLLDIFMLYCIFIIYFLPLLLYL